LVVISGPRQVGKSFLERTVCSWRLHQAERFGMPQDVLHVAHKVSAASEVWRPAARWEMRNGAKVRWTNGEQQIELDDGSRWLVQAANEGAGVAFSLSMALIDEAWRVQRKVVDGAISPTLIEASSPQLWLVSTAGTSDSDLMLAYRAAAAAEVDSPGNLLLIEWSAPADDSVDIADPAVWRMASPHWDDRRAERVAQYFATIDEYEFRQQWLNQWVPARTAPLFDALAWQASATGGMPAGQLTFGVDVSSDRGRAVIVALCGGVAELVDDHPGAGWCASRLADLAAKWKPSAIGVDVSGPAATVADQLAADTAVADLLVRINGRDMAVASGRTFDAIRGQELVGTQASTVLAGAVSAARQRRFGQAWQFDRGAPDGVVMVALAAAHWAAERQPEPIESS